MNSYANIECRLQEDKVDDSYRVTGRTDTGE